MARGAFRGGRRIIEFMRESRRKLSQRCQPVALLLQSGGFANSVGHQPHEPLGQLRHLLNKFGKQRGRKTQSANIRDRPRPHRKLFHPGKGQHPRHTPRVDCHYHGFAAELAADCSCPSRITNMASAGSPSRNVRIACLDDKFFRLADEPSDLIVGQIGECRNGE